MPKKPDIKFPTSPTGETDELCDRGEDGKQCVLHPAHCTSCSYDPLDPKAKHGRLTVGKA